MEYKTEIYETSKGKLPYSEWLESLDHLDANRILVRVDRLRIGNFTKCEPVGGSVHEIKMDFGPGYRVYFSSISTYHLLILLGGCKRTQKKDIEKAKDYLKDYKMRGKHAKK